MTYYNVVFISNYFLLYNDEISRQKNNNKFVFNNIK